MLGFKIRKKEAIEKVWKHCRKIQYCTKSKSHCSDVLGAASVDSLSISVSSCETTRSITPPPSLPRPLQVRGMRGKCTEVVHKEEVSGEAKKDNIFRYISSDHMRV